MINDMQGSARGRDRACKSMAIHNYGEMLVDTEKIETPFYNAAASTQPKMLRGDVLSPVH